MSYYEMGTIDDLATLIREHLLPHEERRAEHSLRLKDKRFAAGRVSAYRHVLDIIERTVLTGETGTCIHYIGRDKPTEPEVKLPGEEYVPMPDAVPVPLTGEEYVPSEFLWSCHNRPDCSAQYDGRRTQLRALCPRCAKGEIYL